MLDLGCREICFVCSFLEWYPAPGTNSGVNIFIVPLPKSGNDSVKF